jgi:hypothetical protein
MVDPTTAGGCLFCPLSLGVYWIPVYEILEARGFEVLLVNATDAKNVPGRKTDINDAQWFNSSTSTDCCAPAFVRANRNRQRFSLS